MFVDQRVSVPELRRQIDCDRNSYKVLKNVFRNHSDMICAAAGNNVNPVQVFDIIVREL